MKAWRGVIEEYRDFLPVSDKTPIVTLYEGNTPLVPAPRLAEATDVRMTVRKVDKLRAFVTVAR